MPHHVLTRQQLYELVWAEPIRTVALRFGVSDVGLAKACRRAGIPTPPRGYWAKLQHNKATDRRPPLPRRPDLADEVVVAPAPPKTPPKPAVQAALDQALDLEPVAVPATLRDPHPVVRRWIDQNEQTRRQARRQGWTIPVDDWSDTLRRRQLRIYSSLLKSLEQHGFKAKGEHHPDGGVVISDVTP